MDYIVVKGAKENNLKNVDIKLPKNKFIVMTGVSGSGKSSLAFDTIYQEGERRFVESLSSYARQFIGSKEKPNVDSIEGLSPAISIDQKSTSHNPRSTVGTVTEIYDFLRVLYAKIGKCRCINHDIYINSQTLDEITSEINKIENGKKVYILAKINYVKKELTKTLDDLLKKGFIRIYYKNEIYEIEELDKSIITEDFYVVIERFIKKDDMYSRYFEACELASKLGNGFVNVLVELEDFKTYSTVNKCPVCGYEIPELEPRLFSFNSPIGACKTCNGLGHQKNIDRSLVIDEELSIKAGCIIPYKNADDGNLYLSELEQTCNYYNIDLNKPFKDLKKEEQDIILYGSKDIIDYKLYSNSGRYTEKSKAFEGVIVSLNRRYNETTSEWIREWLDNYAKINICTECVGKRLNKEALSVYINDKNIYDLASMSISDLYDFFANLKLNQEQQKISNLAVKEIMDRLKFLLDVGLNYLSLSRSATSLSGGEAQRIRLATQIGSRLTGVLYVLDEPSIGLHQKDNDRLIKALKDMRDLGNTLIVVEHDFDTMNACDYLVDVGPLAGIHGGNIVACGTVDEVKKSKDSITAKYLTKEYKIEIPKYLDVSKNKFLKIIKAKENNLKNIDVKIPLNAFVCVTGVSGSGKSTLVNDILLNNIEAKLTNNKKIIKGKCKEIKGLEYITRVIDVSQQPIGRTPRSNPATYTGVFDDIREIFSQTTEAKMKGYDKSRFSFNVKGGRCEACCGDGVKKISMHFLPDVYVDCEVCHGKRYQKETLEIKFKGKNIYDVLKMRVEEALEFFSFSKKITDKLEALNKVGLGYIELGQSSTTLSGGEAQRIKLAYELSKKVKDGTLYILDEPTTGLHTHDIKKLLDVLFEIRNSGGSLVIIEHNLDVIKCADYIIDLGKEGGVYGGDLIFEGTVNDIIKDENSYTGIYLKKYLGEE